MHRAVALLVLLLVGCYRPPGDSCVICGPGGVCPAGLACDRGYCGGPETCAATADAPVTDGVALADAAASCSLGLFATTKSILQPPTNAVPTYTASDSEAIAAFKYNASTIGTAKLEQIDWVPAFSDQQAMYRGPVMAPDGDEIFVHTAAGDAGPYVLAVSIRQASSWSLPVALDTGLNISAEDLPGTPTLRTASPRRMVIETASGLTELEESEPRRWKAVEDYTPADLDAETITHPQLSPDGLRLLVVVEDLGGRSIIALRRTSTGGRFGPPAVRLLAGDVAHPFLTADCTRLYYYRRTSDRIELAMRQP